MHSFDALPERRCSPPGLPLVPVELSASTHFIGRPRNNFSHKSLHLLGTVCRASLHPCPACGQPLSQMRSAAVQIRCSNCPNALQTPVQLRYRQPAIAKKSAARGSPLAATGLELSTAVALCLKILRFKPFLLPELPLPTHRTPPSREPQFCGGAGAPGGGGTN
jgi:hypothetical protein